MKRRWTLRSRFLLLLVLLLLLVFVAITEIIVSKSTATLKKSLVDQSKSFAALATQPIGNSYLLYKDSGTIRIGQEIDSFTNLDLSINQVEITDTKGQILYARQPHQMINVSEASAQSVDPSYIHNRGGDLTAIIQPYVESFGIHRYNLVYGVSYSAVDQSIASIVKTILLLSIAILLISLVIWYFLMNRLFLRPVAKLSRAALQISRGDLNSQMSLSRSDEIGDLADAVNTMANSLKDDIAKLKEVDSLKNEFIMIASHNLRTPLTIIQASLDTIASLKPTTEVKDLLEPIGVSALRLGGFAEDMLTISTIEAGQNIVRPKPTPIEPVLRTIAEEFTALASHKKLHFTSDINTPVTVNLSRVHFRSALWNLLDNAYKFTPVDGQIKLIAKIVGNQVEITVIDSGIGIRAQEIPKLFTKFHRGTDTQTYDFEGTGIGLYIAKIIVEQHGGQITVDSTEGKGSNFHISLPVLPTSSSSFNGEQNRDNNQSQPDQRDDEVAN